MLGRPVPLAPRPAHRPPLIPPAPVRSARAKTAKDPEPELCVALEVSEHLSTLHTPADWDRTARATGPHHATATAATPEYLSYRPSLCALAPLISLSFLMYACARALLPQLCVLCWSTTRQALPRVIIHSDSSHSATPYRRAAPCSASASSAYCLQASVGQP